MHIKLQNLKPITSLIHDLLKNKNTKDRSISEIKGNKEAIQVMFNEGSRNNDFFRLSCALIEAGLTPDQTWILLTETNKTIASSPINSDELKSLFESSLKRTTSKADTAKPLIIYSLDDFFNKDIFKDPIPIVEGLINRAEFHICSAPAKVGKTHLGIHLSYSIATGGKFMNHFKCIQGKVLVVQTEVSENQLKKRLMTQILFPSEEIMDQLLFTSKRIKIDTRDGLKELEGVMVQHKPDLILLDPFYTLHNKNEDSSTEIAPVLSDLRELAITHDVAILMIHHQGKSKEGGVQTGHKHRGSSSFADAPDGSWSLNHVEGCTYTKLSFEMRNIESPGPFKCRLQKETLTWEIEGEFEEKSANNFVETNDFVEHVKENEGLTTSELIADMVDNFGVGKRTVQKQLKMAYKGNHLFKKKFGRQVRHFSNETCALEYASKRKGNALKNDDECKELDS